jgi:hypothetical protein
MICAEARESLGVFVLGALPAAEADQVRCHLEACPRCYAGYHDLAALPALLNQVDEAEARLGPRSADGAILDRLLSQVSTERRRRRGSRMLAAAAAVVLVAGGSALAAELRAAHRPAPGATSSVAGGSARQAPLVWQRVSAENRATGVQASVLYARDVSGTRAKISLAGVEAGERCMLVAVGHDGQRQVASSWTATYGGEAEVGGEVPMSAGDIARFEVDTFDGRMLAQIPVTTI